MSKNKISRREVLKLTGFSVLGATAKLAFPSQALSWSAVIAFNSHGWIDTQAYNALSALPFFDSNFFPKLENILEHEGVNPVTGRGGGPDVDGATHYSEHYYNPVLGGGEGLGPETCGKYAETIYQRVAEQNATLPNKETAWAAHFLADMCVPFHVVGCSVETLKVFKPNEEGKIHLMDTIYGDMGLAYRKVWTPTPEFTEEVSRYKAAYTKDEKTDWFDPWYWNGAADSLPWQTSSHVYWESDAYTTPSLSNLLFEPKYDGLWDNRRPDFDEPWKEYRKEAVRFAKVCAGGTRDKLVPLFKNMVGAQQRAVNKVYTLWRGSITALQAKLKITISSRMIGYKISFIVTNKEKYPVYDVRARVSLLDRKGIVVKDLGKINVDPKIPGGNSREKKNALTLKSLGPKMEAPYSIRLEVIGRYEHVPDAQYKVIENKISIDASRSFYKGQAIHKLKGVRSNNDTIECPENIDLSIELAKDLSKTSGSTFFSVVFWTGNKLNSYKGKMSCKIKDSKWRFKQKFKFDGNSPFNFKNGVCELIGKFDESKITGKLTYKGKYLRIMLTHEVIFTLPIVDKMDGFEINQLESSAENDDFVIDSSGETKGDWNELEEFSD